MKYLLVPLLLLSLNIFPQNFKQVKIYLNGNTVSRIQDAGINLTEFITNKDNSITTFFSDSDFKELAKTGISYEVLIDDWMAYYNNLPKLTPEEKENYLQQSKMDYNVTGFTYGSMGGFYTYQEIIRDLDSMYARYPNIITQKQVIGTSHLGRSIYGVKISDNPNVNENEPGVGFDALVHAREPQSMATLMYFMWYLLENYGVNPEVTYLVNNRQIFCVPVFNPDGYEKNRTTNPSGGGMWRKNRRNNSEVDGVDLNRNFSYMWGYDNNGSSPTPSSETYRGPSAFSEPESQAVRDWIIGKNIGTYFNMHSYQDAILYPWGYINALTPDSETYIEFASDMCALNNYVYGNSSQILGYASNGSVRDWLYGEQTTKGKIYGYTIEIGNAGDNFWPPQSRIFPIAQQNLKSNLYQCQVAGDYVKVTGWQMNPQYLNPGDTITVNSILRNKGLASAHGLTLQLSSLSPDAQVINGSFDVDSVPARSNIISQYPVKIFISPSAPLAQFIPFLVTLSKSGDIINQDTVRMRVGTPIYTFIDNSNTIDSMWLITATPTTPKWESTTTSFFSPPNSYTDSKTGNYVSNATVTLTTKNPIDLAGITNPVFSFKTKHDIELNWDCGIVQVSTNNGSTWTTLGGSLTVPASGSGKQIPAGMPVYEGTRTAWTSEEISLSAYSGSQIKLRFELRTDGSDVRDGWYLDDIGVYYYGIVPVELISFRAETVTGGRKLTWSTVTELNNRGFEIEKSFNGKEWQIVGFIPGSGTTSEKNNYSFTDVTTYEGMINYRLKQLDYDGTFNYSAVIESDGIFNREYTLAQNYPNPFNPMTTIEFNLPDEDKVTLKIYDLRGSQIATLLNENRPAGRHTVEFDASKFSSGVYFYQLNSGGKLLTRKMMILK
jgi:carboxypeptidase T